jgi:D-aminopeptidase
LTFRRVLIIADMEGSSGCWSYAASALLKPEWALACADMTRDVGAVVQALFVKGVEEIIVKDFHRTGFNLLPERIDRRARIDQGYATGPIPGMGDPGGAQAALFLGLHAASGTEGFLPHTMTSRLAQVRVNGRLLPEVALFAALLAPYGIRPVFFSGCPTACRQAAAEIPGISTYALDRRNGPAGFDGSSWRRGLARRAAAALDNKDARPLADAGPYAVQVVLRDGATRARQMARRWRLKSEGATVHLDVKNLATLFMILSRICYLHPLVLPLLPVALRLHRFLGRAGLVWVRRQLRQDAVRQAQAHANQ